MSNGTTITGSGWKWRRGSGFGAGPRPLAGAPRPAVEAPPLLATEFPPLPPVEQALAPDQLVGDEQNRGDREPRRQQRDGLGAGVACFERFEE